MFTGVSAHVGGDPVTGPVKVRFHGTASSPSAYPRMRDDAAWRAGHAAGVIPASDAFEVARVCSLIGLEMPASHRESTTTAAMAGILTV